MPPTRELTPGDRPGRLRIAYLDYVFGEYSTRLVNALARDADVLLLMPIQVARPYLPTLNPSVSYDPFATPRLRQPLAQMRMVASLVRKIRAFRADVIHVQQGHLWFNLALPLVAGYPLVVTIHDVVHHPGDRYSQPVPQPLLDLGYRRADEVIVHAPQLKPLVNRRLGIPAAKVHVIPHVTMGNDSAQAEEFAYRHTILFFGRIWPYKGLDYLIRAEPLISEAVPDVRIVIAGKGEDLGRYRQMMVHAERFTVHNAEVTDDERAELFAKSAVVVLPYIEASQSGVIPVAYNAGRPVVATAVGGLPAMVDDGVTGCLVPPCDEKSLAAAIVHLLLDDELRRQMGRSAKRKVEAECAPDVIAGQILAVYRAAIGDRGGC